MCGKSGFGDEGKSIIIRGKSISEVRGENY